MVRVVFGLLLAGFGGLLVYGGLRAVSERSYEFRSRFRASVERVEGTEAVRLGSGLAAFGALLALWGLALLPPPAPAWTARHAAVGWLSFALLLGSAITIFPPWRLPGSPLSIGLYASALMTLVVLWQSEALSKYSSHLILAMLLAAIALSPFQPSATAGILLGVLLAVTLAFHVGVLVPRRAV